MRLYLYAAALLALAGLGGYVWNLKGKADKLDQAEARLVQVEAKAKADLRALQAAREHERKIANDASNKFQTAVTGLQDELSKRPLKPVVIRVSNGPLSCPGGSAGTASGSDAEAEGREHGSATEDITAGLTNYMLDCQINTLQLEGLQSWVLAR